MSSSISNTAQDSIQLMMQQMFQKMQSADTDGISGLSKDELSSIDSSGDVGGSAFLKSLTEQFNSLDTDGNGELSAEEISNAKPPSGPMGPPPSMSIEDGSYSSDSSNSTKNMIEEILEQILSNLEKSVDGTSESNSSNSDKLSSLVSAADSDGNGSISLSELSSVNASNNTGEAGFVNDLKKNFDNYDTNSDGALSNDEMLAAMPNDNSITSSTNSSNSLNSLANSFIEKLLSAYKNSDLASASSLISEAV